MIVYKVSPHLLVLMLFHPQLTKVVCGETWEVDQAATGQGTEDDGKSKTGQLSVTDGQTSSTILDASSKGAGEGLTVAETENKLSNGETLESYNAQASGSADGETSNSAANSTIQINEDGTSELAGETINNATGSFLTRANSAISVLHSRNLLKTGLTGRSVANGLGFDISSSNTFLNGTKRTDGSFAGHGGASATGNATHNADVYTQTGFQKFKDSETPVDIISLADTSVRADDVNTSANSSVHVDSATDINEAGGTASFTGDTDGIDDFQFVDGQARAGAVHEDTSVLVDGSSSAGAGPMEPGDSVKHIEADVSGNVSGEVVTADGNAEQSITTLDGGAIGYNDVRISAVDVNGQHDVAAGSQTVVEGDELHTSNQAHVVYDESGGRASESSTADASATDGQAYLYIDSVGYVDTHDSTNSNAANHLLTADGKGGDVLVYGDTGHDVSDTSNSGHALSAALATNTDGASSASSTADGTIFNDGVETEVGATADSSADGEQSSADAITLIEHDSDDDLVTVAHSANSEASGAGTTSAKSSGTITMPGKRRKRFTRADRLALQ